MLFPMIDHPRILAMIQSGVLAQAFQPDPKMAMIAYTKKMSHHPYLRSADTAS
jgi:hypothetical protein